jgi:hypothetical protein
MRRVTHSIRLVLTFGLAFGLGGCIDAETDLEQDVVSERGPIGKADLPGSCLASDGGDFCGGKSNGACWCDDLCASFGDCCGDKQPVCDGTDPGSTLCMSDETCGAGEICDHSECLSNCPAGMVCPAVCWGQCQEAPTECPDVCAAICAGQPEPAVPQGCAQPLCQCEPPTDPNTCDGACGGKSEGACWCDDLCQSYGDCCDDYDVACTEPVDVCDAIVADFTAETTEIRSCTADAECGQVLSGTSCGCTRNWVARTDADLTEWETLRDDAFANGCSVPGGISTCDCPAADGFACNAGTCTWNYL